MTSDAIDVYWRPGCGFCMALDRQLDGLGLPMNRINIWEEPGAADFVRTHANGNETVPTVAIGDVVLVNPRPDDVVSVMRTETPYLVPDGVEVGESRFRLRRRRTARS